MAAQASRQSSQKKNKKKIPSIKDLCKELQHNIYEYDCLAPLFRKYCSLIPDIDGGFFLKDVSLLPNHYDELLNIAIAIKYSLGNIIDEGNLSEMYKFIITRGIYCKEKEKEKIQYAFTKKCPYGFTILLDIDADKDTLWKKDIFILQIQSSSYLPTFWTGVPVYQLIWIPFETEKESVMEEKIKEMEKLTCNGKRELSRHNFIPSRKENEHKYKSFYMIPFSNVWDIEIAFMSISGEFFEIIGSDILKNHIDSLIDVYDSLFSQNE